MNIRFIFSSEISLVYGGIYIDRASDTECGNFFPSEDCDVIFSRPTLIKSIVALGAENISVQIKISAQRMVFHTDEVLFPYIIHVLLRSLKVGIFRKPSVTAVCTY